MKREWRVSEKVPVDESRSGDTLCASRSSHWCPSDGGKKRFGEFAVAFVAGTLATASLFAIVSLSQSSFEKKPEVLVDRDIRFTVSTPPKPETTLDERVEQEAPKPLEFQEPLPEVGLKPLGVALNPGYSDSRVLNGHSALMDFQIDAMKEVERIYSTEELDTVPSLLSLPRPDYPTLLKRRGILSVTLEILFVIDQNGRARVETVLSASHPEIVPVAKDMINRARFTVPMKDGKPEKVRVKKVLTLEAS